VDRPPITGTGTGGVDVRVVVLGPPGSGKGTQARLLASHLGVTHLSVGAVLRAEVASQSQLGVRIAAKVAAGDLVPVDDVLAVLAAPLTMTTRSGGWVLDGAPRTVEQAAAIDSMLAAMDAAADRVVALEVPDTEVRARLAHRALLEHRADDTEEVITHRLAVWAREGLPVMAWYEQQARLTRVDGTGEVTVVARRVSYAIERSRAGRVS
jgi:adenylate kinase